MKISEQLKTQLNELSGATYASYLSKASQNIQKRVDQNKPEKQPDKAKELVDLLKSRGKDTKYLEGMVKKDPPRSSWADKPLRAEIGTVRKASDGKHYKFHGSQWVEHNKETGKSSRIASKEIGNELNNFETQKIKNRLDSIKTASKRVSGESPVKKPTPAPLPTPTAPTKEVKQKKTFSSFVDNLKTKAKEFNANPNVQAAKEKVKSVASDAKILTKAVAGEIKNHIQKSNTDFYTNKFALGNETPKSFASAMKKGHVDQNIQAHRDFYNQNKAEIDKHMSSKKSSLSQKFGDLEHKVASIFDGGKHMLKKPEFNNRPEGKPLGKFVEDEKAKDKPLYDKRIRPDGEHPYVMHVKYKATYGDGKSEMIHERIPFTAKNDFHAEDKRRFVFKNMQNKMNHEIAQSGDNTKLSNFEMGGHYHAKRQRAFQFIMSPDTAYHNKSKTPEKVKTKTVGIQPVKWLTGRGNLTKKVAIDTKSQKTPSEFKPQVMTVYHRSKKEAEEIARDNFLQKNNFPSNTKVKVHGSHWV